MSENIGLPTIRVTIFDKRALISPHKPAHIIPEFAIPFFPGVAYEASHLV
jgi:hypothetical protein